MGDRALIGQVEADRQRSTESYDCEGDIRRSDVLVDRAVAYGALDQTVEHVLSGGTPIGPVAIIDQRVHDVYGAEAGVDRSVHVATQGLAGGGCLEEGSFALLDRAVDHFECHGSEELLLIGEVSVQGADTEPGSLGDRVPGRLPADLEDHLDRGVEESPAVPSSVGSRRWVPRARVGVHHGNGVYSSASAKVRDDGWRIALEDQESARRTMTIAEAIEAVRDTEHLPVTFESCEHIQGPFFHVTKTAFYPGDELVPGTRSNYHDGRVSNHVYFSALLEPAIWGAELAVALAEDGSGHIYVVEPTGPFEDDPNVTNKRFPGNVTQSYRTRHPMRIVGEVQTWDGHPPEVLQGMLDSIARLREQGLDAIED
jgi:hypothetical protein